MNRSYDNIGIDGYKDALRDLEEEIEDALLQELVQQRVEELRASGYADDIRPEKRKPDFEEPLMPLEDTEKLKLLLF